MATKIKGIFKSLKYIAQIFVGVVVVKEREMEIGYPTDVKHVAHIGWDGHSGSGPSWMNEFKAATDFSTPSLSERRHTNNPIPNPVTTRDFEESTGNQATQNIDEGIPSDEIADVPKKHKRKKTKSKAMSCEIEATIAQ